MNTSLGEFIKCSICQEYGWVNTHKCGPSWMAYRPDHSDEDEAVRVFVPTDEAEDAAIKYAEINFSNWEYPRSVDVEVRRSEDDKWEKFTVYVESVPSFSAERTEE